MPAWFGRLGPMGWPLLACAVLSLALCFERLAFYARTRPDAVRRRLREAFLPHREHPRRVREMAAELLLGELRGAFYRGVGWLRVIGMMSPMLGLLGTALGVVAVFRALAAHAGPIVPGVIADGLWEALLTTVFGLLIALPTLLMAHVFRGLGARRLEACDRFLKELSLSFELAGARGAAEDA